MVRLCIAFLIIGFLSLNIPAYGEDNIILLSKNIFLRRMEIPREDHSLITLYISAEKDEKPVAKPVIILVQGSGCDSLFPRIGDKNYRPFLFKELIKYNKDWHIVFVEKRGVGFGDNSRASGYEKCTQEYIDNSTKENRAKDISAVIDYLDKNNIYNHKNLVLIGHSEGSHVVPSVALMNHKVTHVALLGYSASHGLQDFLSALRKDLEADKISPLEFNDRYNGLIYDFREIYKNRASKNNFYQGHTYMRWNSYALNSSLDDLLKIKVPVFLGIASSDMSSPASGSDMVIAEFIKAGKNNLTYKNYVGFDHGFFLRKDNNENYSGQEEVLADILKWL